MSTEPSPNSPFVRAAIICERVLCEKDDILSAIRIVDGLSTPAPTPDPVGKNINRFQLALLLMTVRGDAPAGGHSAWLKTQLPSGEFTGHKQIGLELGASGPEQGSSLVIDLSFEPLTEGVYWFWFSWDREDNVLTRVPLTVSFARSTAEEEPHAPRS